MIRVFLLLLTASLSLTVSASEISLMNGKKYKVPIGKVWVIKDVPVSTCRACTSDVYVSGLSQVEVSGITFNGYFEFSFTRDFKGPVHLYEGTEIRLGESRENLSVQEIEK